MSGFSPSRRWLPASTALLVPLLLALPSAAAAAPPPTPPGHGSGAGHSAAAPGHAKPAPTHGHTTAHTTGHGSGHTTGHSTGHPATPPAHSHAGGQAKGGTAPAGAVPGNNGTVKIKGIGDLGTIPNNVPHPGCDFQVMWYGFDQGATIVSTVTFAMQAPTAGVGLTVSGPTSVFVGGDPATGAGTATGLDGSATYHLAFSGPAQAKQGYHVRLTVHTPYSQGNDTKTKVFWVSDCTPATTSSSTTSSAPPTVTAGPPPGTSIAVSTPFASTAFAGTPVASSVSAPRVPSTTTAVPVSDVPHSVAAGTAGRPWPAALARAWHRTALPLALIGLGLAVAGGAALARRRGHVAAPGA
jgi:hypothetical protein